MNPEQLKHRELVSALADGQLRGAEFARAVGLATRDDDAAATWHAYHLVGEVLRSGDIGGGSADPGFLARFEARLAQQGDTIDARADLPVAIEYIADYAYSAEASGQFDQINSKSDSANQSSYRWKLVAAVASLAAVGAIGWNSLGNSPGAADTLSALQPSSQISQVTQAPAPVVAAAPQAVAPQVMIRDPHLDALLAAHKQFGGTSALQMPAGFIRNATFEANGR